MRKPKNETERKQVLGSIVEESLNDAEGGQSDELQSNRTSALKYYYGEPRGDEIEGRSDAISMDVANSTNAMLAMMRDMLILDAELVIEPEGEQDAAMAKAESDICSDVLLKDNQGEKVLLSAIKDGLLLKNGCTKVRVADGSCVVEAVPIENISYTAGWDGDLQEVPFFAENIAYSRSDLVAMGISKKQVYELQAGYDAYATGTTAVRDNTTQASDGTTTDQDVIDCHEAYVLTDMDGDGISERYRVLVANGRETLEYEAVDVVPFALGSPFINPHRLTGESVFDRLRHIQDSNTKFLRQWHDNVAIINNGRYIYDPSQTTEEDVMTPTAGGGIRARNPSQSVIPVLIPDVASGIIAAMEYNRRQRTEAVGAALDMSSAEAQLANKAATVASIEKGNQELVSSMVAGNFALTLILGTFRLIHYHLRMFSTRPYLATVHGQAVPVDPTQWRPRTRMYVRAGMSPSQKATQQQALMMHVQAQAQAMSAGMDGVLADPTTIYRTQLRWLRANGVEDPESLLIDPSSQKAQQAQQSKAQQAQQMAQMQQQMAEMQFQMEQAKLAEDARQHDAEIKHKYYDTDMDAEVAEAKIAGQGVIDLEKQRMSDESTKQRGAEGSAASTGGAD